jgi:uncharacterized protein
MDLQGIRKKVPFNLDRFESLYDTFDKGHDRRHVERVREGAVQLALKYAPEQAVLAYIAATLHDIGISVEREKHEEIGARMILEDEEIKQKLTGKDIKALAEAVGEHRASTGKPKTILAKIVSDADRTSAASPSEFLMRPYEYGKKHFPDLTDEEQLFRSAEHLKKKYGEGGYGARYFFPESEAHQRKLLAPILAAFDKKDIPKLWEILKQGE